MSEVTHNTIPNFGDLSKSEEEKKKDTMMAWVGMTSVEDLRPEDRKKFLDAISGVKKEAARPLPIPKDFIDKLVNTFSKRVLRVFSVTGMDPYEWSQRYKSFPEKSYLLSMILEYNLQHRDVAGRPTVTKIVMNINPYRKVSSLTNLALPESEKAKYGISKDERVNFLDILVGDDMLKKWFRWASLASKGDRQRFNDIFIGSMRMDLHNTVSHELTHAFDNPPSTEEFIETYRHITDSKDSTEEQIDLSRRFYFTTREELKAHVNQTISEIEYGLSVLGIEGLLENSFIELLEKYSTLFRQIRERLKVSPDDYEYKALGKDMAKRKNEAWRKYLGALYSWWEATVERAREYQAIEKNSSKERYNRKVARKNRQTLISKLLNK